MGIRPAHLLALAMLSVALGRPSTAQTTPAVENVELEPIACYWRTSTDAVRLGEPFTLVLTCGVLDTAATTVVPDQSRLDPAVLQLQPFEVIGGTAAPDLRTPARRYFQYEYRLRYVGEDVGRDLQLPPLTLTYRVQNRVQQNSAAVEGREREYILPAHMIRVLSTVPATARDIRDVAPVTLADIDARRFRATVLRVVSWTLYAVSAVLAVWALVALTRRRTRTVAVVRHTSDGAVLAAVQRELDDVRRARTAGGWDDALVARALAALRVGASYAAGLPVSQTPVRPGSTLLSGQVRIAGRWPRGTDVVVSGAATPMVLAHVREQQDDVTPAHRARLSEFEDVLGRFTEAAYGREGAAARDTLDDAMNAGERAIRGVRREYSWLAVQLRSLQQRAGHSMRARGWARS